MQQVSGSLQSSFPEGSNNNKKDYLFSLKGIGPYQKSKLNVEMLFLPVDGEPSSCPRLGPVKNHLFSAFHFPSPYFAEPWYVAKSAIQFGMLKDHQLREKSQIYVPVLESDKCHVCKTKFQNYHAHINQKEHKENVRASPINKYIQELCAKFGNKEDSSQEKKKKWVEMQPKDVQFIDCDEASPENYDLLDERKESENMLRDSLDE